jgi:hypothetical protein
MAKDGDSDGSIRAARYRELAAALRALAQAVKNADAQGELYAIARDYDVLAEHAERVSYPMAPVPDGSVA